MTKKAETKTKEAKAAAIEKPKTAPITADAL